MQRDNYTRLTEAIRPGDTTTCDFWDPIEEVTALKVRLERAEDSILTEAANRAEVGLENLWASREWNGAVLGVTIKRVRESIMARQALTENQSK